MHAMEAASVSTQHEWSRLPETDRDAWLGHAYNKLTGWYEPDPTSLRQNAEEREREGAKAWRNEVADWYASREQAVA